MKTPVDGLMDVVLSVVAQMKETHYRKFAFETLLAIAEELRAECPSAVAGYKCYVVFDKKIDCFKIGIFPVDASQNTFGGEDVVMRIVRANEIDEKLQSLTKDGQEGSFFVPVK